MKTLNAPDTISGKEGRAYAKVNGNNEELFYAKTIEGNVEKSKSEVKSIGKRMVGHKTTGANGTGSMTLYYLSPLFRDMVKNWKETGVDVYFDMVVENDDQESSAGKQSVLLIGCNLDSVEAGRRQRRPPGRRRRLHLRGLRRPETLHPVLILKER